MQENGVEYTVQKTEEEAIADSYFGGAIKFRTKIVWLNAIAFAFLHLLGAYGIYLSIYQMMHLQFLTTVFSK